MNAAQQLLPFAIVILAMMFFMRRSDRSPTPSRFFQNESDALGDYQPSNRYVSPENIPTASEPGWFEKLIATLAATVILWHFVVNNG